MEAKLIRSRYKVTQVLHAGTQYAALLAVDIVSRDKAEYLLNVYEGGAGKQFVSLYERLKHCPEYVDMFVSDGALVAVFRYRRGQGIDDVFYKGAVVDWKTRAHYAQLLLHLALSVSDFPPEIGCAAFLSDNLSILPLEMKLAVNYIAAPAGHYSKRELIYLLSDNIRKVLIKRFQMSGAERDFVEDLESGLYTSVITLYSVWQDVLTHITQEYETVFRRNAFLRALYFTGKRIGRVFRKRKRAPK